MDCCTLCSMFSCDCGPDDPCHNSYAPQKASLDQLGKFVAISPDMLDERGQTAIKILANNAADTLERAINAILSNRS